METLQDFPMDQQDFLENINEDENLEDAAKRSNKTPNQYFFRHHYLSIIQEEEETSDVTPCSSRASSRPGSIYGLRSLAAYKSKESTPDSPKRSPKRKTDSIGSQISADSINSILTDEGSCKTYSTISNRKSRGRLTPYFVDFCKCTVALSSK